MLELSVKEFAEALSAKQSVPGGGGASAMAGALGACCANMAGEFTLGKAKYAEHEADVAESMQKLSELREKLLSLVEVDAAAFEPLSKAYSIPKDLPGRAETLEKCLRAACEVPCEILRCSCLVVSAMQNIANYGSVLMVSDVATGAALAGAAIRGALVNIKANTCLMADKAFAKGCDAEAGALADEFIPKAEKTYEYAAKKAAKNIKEGELLTF